MPRSLVHDRAAQRDLIDIWVYTFQTWGEAQAERYLDALERGIDELGQTPERGRVRQEIREGYRSKLIQHHVVFYTFNDNEVRIRRVLHEAMDFEEHMPAR